MLQLHTHTYILIILSLESLFLDKKFHMNRCSSYLLPIIISKAQERGDKILCKDKFKLLSYVSVKGSHIIY